MRDFLAENGPRRAREVFKKLPGGRGFVLTEYEPVGSHGGPIHAHFYKFRTPILCPTCPFFDFGDFEFWVNPEDSNFIYFGFRQPIWQTFSTRVYLQIAKRIFKK